MIEINKNDKIVAMCVASAKGERMDSNDIENANKVIADLAKNPNPNNRYQIAQLIGFAVNEILKPQLSYLDYIADVKRVGYGDKAQFKVKLEGIRAYIQAKGSTTARSKVASKSISLETVDVSARPVVNVVEMQNGLVNMADLINDASYQMTLKINQYAENVLNTAATSFGTNYYGSGSGLVKATLDPMIYHWMRMGGKAALVGDITLVSQLAGLTGFNAATGTLQFAANIINEQNQNGFIGTYLNSDVIQLINPPVDGTDAPVYNTKKLYILPTMVDSSMRPLKVVLEGDVVSNEATNIDDLTFEVRLDQYFGAAVVYGERPYMGVYADTSP